MSTSSVVIWQHQSVHPASPVHYRQLGMGWSLVQQTSLGVNKICPSAHKKQIHLLRVTKHQMGSSCSDSTFQVWITDVVLVPFQGKLCSISLAALAIEGNGTNNMFQPIFVWGMGPVNFILLRKDWNLWHHSMKLSQGMMNNLFNLPPLGCSGHVLASCMRNHFWKVEKY